MNRLEQIRVQVLNPAEPRGSGDYVLYWMTAERRAHWSFGLDRAAYWADKLGLGVLVFEPLRIAYPYASDRFHRFVIEGMRVNARDFEAAGVTYYPYVERSVDEDKGLLKALADNAAVVIADRAPMFFFPHLLDAGAGAVSTRLEAIDGRGILPLDEAGRHFTTAYSFRRHMQKHVGPHLVRPPSTDAFAGLKLPKADVPASVTKRWPAASAEELERPAALIASLDIDHTVTAVSGEPGGADQARQRLHAFLDHAVNRYADDRSHPDLDIASGLSSHLHFGHVSPFEIFDAVVDREGGFSPDQLNLGAKGSRAGFWGMSPGVEGFLDQLVTWRELGAHTAAFLPDDKSFDSLPDFAKKTLRDHAADPRPYLYSQEEFDAAATHDELWNAAQRQLVREGRIHNALRMLWGKKILHWTKRPEDALRIMFELNDRYALDGRDPNSVSGIMWVLGRYDRAWGPEREIFGKVRYMTSESSRRKWKLKNYLERYSKDAPQLSLAV